MTEVGGKSRIGRANKGAKPGERRGGRQKGTPNKTTTMLKEAIIAAAEKAGSDKKGKDGLVGYCHFLATNEPKAFSQLLGKVLPMQIAGDSSAPLTIKVVRGLGDE